MEFTVEAREILELANTEARQLNHEYIGTEHLLLAFANDACREYLPAHILPAHVRQGVGKYIQPGPRLYGMTKLPQTPRARAVLQAADKHAGPRKVSPLDILQALYSEQDGAAYQVMMDLKWFPETKVATPPISIIGRITELEKRLALLEERIG